MKTKLGLLLVVAALLQAATGEAQLATGVTLTNLQGQVYNNITIDHTNKLGVIWKGADGGMGQIKYNELAMECWVKLNLSDSAQKYDEAIALQTNQVYRISHGWHSEIRCQPAAIFGCDNSSGVSIGERKSDSI